MRRPGRRRRQSIRMFWYRPNEIPGGTNFGDELGAYIVERVSGRQIERCDIEDTELLSVGSILEMAIKTRRTEPFPVWGSGFIRRGGAKQAGRFEVAAARGALSAERLLATGVPLGDPALCLSLFTTRSTPRHALGIVPHYIDVDNRCAELASGEHGVTFIDPRRPHGEVVETIGRCEAIVSSSLHGCIVADALGVPNAWIKLSDKLSGGDYKFRDYYSALGIVDPEAIVVDSASQLDPGRLETTLSAWSRPAMQPIAERIAAAFPLTTN